MDTTSFTGERFGKLVVLSFSHCDKYENYSRSYWNCLCDCGNIVEVRRDHLTRGKTRSCGCLRSEKRGYRTDEGHTSLVKIFCNYKHEAKKKKREFEITFEQFERISKLNCYYCGSEPFGYSFMKGANGGVSYNGMDRIDSSRGYTLDNVVPCCGICNRAKLDMTQSDFFLWIKRIVNHIEEVSSANG